MTDWLLGPDHDVVISADGDFVFVSGGEEVAQRINITLRAHQGEWLFDTLFGVPYRTEILVKNPDLGAIEARLRSIVAGVEGVTAITEFSLSLDRVSRILTVDMVVDTRLGAVSTSTSLF